MKLLLSLILKQERLILKDFTVINLYVVRITSHIGKVKKLNVGAVLYIRTKGEPGI